MSRIRELREEVTRPELLDSIRDMKAGSGATKTATTWCHRKNSPSNSTATRRRAGTTSPRGARHGRISLSPKPHSPTTRPVTSSLYEWGRPRRRVRTDLSPGAPAGFVISGSNLSPWSMKRRTMTSSHPQNSGSRSATASATPPARGSIFSGANWGCIRFTTSIVTTSTGASIATRIHTHPDPLPSATRGRDDGRRAVLYRRDRGLTRDACCPRSVASSVRG